MDNARHDMLRACRPEHTKHGEADSWAKGARRIDDRGNAQPLPSALAVDAWPLRTTGFIRAVRDILANSGFRCTIACSPMRQWSVLTHACAHAPAEVLATCYNSIQHITIIMNSIGSIIPLSGLAESVSLWVMMSS